MPLLRAVNIARTLIALKAANIWCIGLDATAPALSGPAFADRRVALVLGAEGEGLRRLTKRNLRRDRRPDHQRRGGEPERLRCGLGRALRVVAALMPFDPAPAAAGLRQVRRERVVVSPLPADIAPRTEAEGAAVQVALASLVNALPPFGFKIGATGSGCRRIWASMPRSPGSWEARTFITAMPTCASRTTSGREWNAKSRCGWRGICHRGRARWSRRMRLWATFFAAIEIVENRYGDLKDLGTPDAARRSNVPLRRGHRRPGQGRLARAGNRRSARSISRAMGHRTRRYVGSPGASAEWIGMARRIAERRGLWWSEGRAGHHAWQRHPADLADRAGRGEVAFPPLPPVTVRLA